MWFKQLTGIDEISPEHIRANIEISGNQMVSTMNGRSFQFGKLEIPSLEELKIKAPAIDSFQNKIRVSELVANVQTLHQRKDLANSLFQAASQFNLLEMIGPHITPEMGIERYEMDHTQGPACAIACGAGTIYRNYFVPLNGRLGQTSDNQIDCLADIGKALNNPELQLWKMVNGYALTNQEGLLKLNALLSALSDDERASLQDRLRIGIQWDTEVTLGNAGHSVTQAYCSALPVAYGHLESIYWESFARIILEATYEATLYVGLLNYLKTGSQKVFLTLVGGGAFGNETNWILESLHKALVKFERTLLDVYIVSYGQSNPEVRTFVEEYIR